MRTQVMRLCGVGRKRRLVAGLSVFGAMLWMGLFGVTTIVVVDQYQSAREGQNKNETNMLLLTMRAHVESIYSGNPNYGVAGTDLVPILAQRGRIPDKALVVTGGGLDGDGNALPTAVEIQHPFGGGVTILGNVGGNPTHFSITFVNIESEVCASLADQFVGRTRARTGIVSVQGPGGTAPAPITRDNVTTSCNATGDVVFVFG